MKLLLIPLALLFASCTVVETTGPDGSVTKTTSPDLAATQVITSATVEIIKARRPLGDK